MGTGLARLAHYSAQGREEAEREPRGLARLARYGTGLPSFDDVEAGSSTSAPRTLLGSLRRATGQAARSMSSFAGPLQVPAIAARLARGTSRTLVSDVQEHGLGETLSDIERGVNLGGQESISATLIGATDLVGADEVADRLRGVRQRYRERLEPRLASGRGARIGTRVATDVGQFVATGGAGRAAVGGAARLLGRSTVGALSPEAIATAVGALERVAKPASLAGRIATDVGFAAPINTAIATDEESSLLGAAAEFTRSPTLERAARSTGLRIATEIGVDAAASSLLHLLSRTGRAKLTSEAGAAKRTPEEAIERDVQRRAARAQETEQAIVGSEAQASGTRGTAGDFDPRDVEAPAENTEPGYTPRPDEDGFDLERPYTPERADDFDPRDVEAPAESTEPGYTPRPDEDGFDLERPFTPGRETDVSEIQRPAVPERPEAVLVSLDGSPARPLDEVLDENLDDPARFALADFEQDWRAFLRQEETPADALEALARHIEEDAAELGSNEREAFHRGGDRDDYLSDERLDAAEDLLRMAERLRASESVTSKPLPPPPRHPRQEWEPAEPKRPKYQQEPGTKYDRSRDDDLAPEELPTLRELGVDTEGLPEDLLRDLDDPSYRAARREAYNTPHTADISTPQRIAARGQAIETAERFGGFRSAETRMGEVGSRELAKRPADAPKVAHIVLGPPASAKSSTFVRRIVQKAPWTTVSDADEFKAIMGGETAGRDAPALHVESASLADEFTDRAIDRGDDLVLAKVGNSAASIDKTLSRLTAAGYQVRLYLSEIPREVSARRAFDRWLKEGRFVPAEYILGVVRDNPTRTYERFRNDPRVSWRERYNNNVAKGQPPVQIEVGPPDWMAPEGGVDGRAVPRSAPGLDARGDGGGQGVEPPGPGRGSGLVLGSSRAPERSGVGEAHPKPDAVGRNAPPAEVRREVGPRLAGADGADDSVTLPDDSRVSVRYRVVEARDLVPSHNAESFSPRPDYPPGVQGRRYHTDRSAQENTVQGAVNLNPDRLIRDTGSAGGTPIITPDGIVLAGNQRTMMLQRAAALHPEKMAAYRKALLAKAERFGLDAAQVEGMQSPVLVREVTDEGFDVSDLPSLRKFNDLSDTPTQKARSTTDEAMARANRLRQAPAALEQFTATIQPDETLRGFLDSARGTAFVRALADEGVFSRAELARYLDPKRDKLSADGRSLIEQMMYAAAVGSPDILDRAPREVLNRLDGSLPAIIRAGEVEGWSIQSKLQDALDLLKRVQDLRAEGKGVKDLKDLAQQGSFLDDDVGQAHLLAEFLEKVKKKSVVTEAFRRYAAEAEAAGRATQSFDVFGYEPPTPETIFAQSFVVPRKELPADPALRMAADSPLHPGWEGASAPPPRSGGIGGTLALEPKKPSTLEQAERILRDPKEAFLARHGMASPAYREAERLAGSQQKISAEEMARQAAERKAAEGSRDQFIEGQEEMFGDAAPAPATQRAKPKRGEGQGSLFLKPHGMASEGLPDAAPFKQGPGATEAPHRAIERVTAALSEAMGLVTREGKLGRGQKKALGIFKPNRRVIRMRSASDVGVFAHEVGHALHELLFGANKGGLSNVPLRPFEHELLPMAQGISDETAREGWAEFWRRWIDNPEAAQRQAPQTWAYVNERLAKEFPGVEQALLEARQRWRTFREANAQSRIFSQISQKESPRHFSIRDWFARRRTEVLDDFAPIQRMVEKLTGGKPKPEEDAATLARLTRGSHGAAEHFLERGTLDFRTLKTNGASLEEVLAPVRDNLDEFRVYLVARRAKELIDRGIETGLRPEDVQLAVTELHGRKGFAKAADELYQYQDRLLNYLRDAGVMSDQTVQKIRAVNQNYVPFFRVRDDQAALGGQSMIFGHLFNPTKRIKGSGREIIDPLESIIKNTYSYVHLAQKQEVSQALARLARRPGAGQFIEKIDAPMVPTRVGRQEIADWLSEILGERFGAEGAVAGRDLASVLSGLDQHEVLTVFRPGDYFKADNMISVLENGKRQWYQVQPELYQALMGMDKEHAAMWARFLSAPAALLRAGATLAPEFIGRNPFRDQISAFVQSEYGFRPGIDIVQGLFHAMKKDDLYWRWKAAGGEGAALVDLDRKSLRAKLVKATQQQTAGQRVTNVVLTPLRMLQALSAFMENATRLGEFRRASLTETAGKAGQQRAAAAAREVSTDFARHGSKTVNLRLIAAFWNARLQGYDRLFRAFKRRPAQTTAKAVAAITMPSIGLFYLNKNDPDYWEVPQWQRDIFWLIPVGKDDTGHTEFMRVPKPFELGIIFGTIPERVLEWAHSEDPTGLQRTLTDLLAGGAGESLPVPTGILPLVENYFNWSVFRKRPLVPRGLEEAHGRDQGTERNSPFARKLGAMLDYSPAKIDNLIFGYSAGLGNLAFRDVPSFIDRATADVAKPAATASDIPGIRGFAVRRPGSTSESVERFYDKRAEARSDRASLRLLRKSQDVEGLAEREEELTEGSAQAAFYDRVADELSDYRAQKRAIEQDPVLSAEEKRRELDRIDDLIVERAAAAIDRRTPATPGGGR